MASRTTGANGASRKPADSFKTVGSQHADQRHGAGPSPKDGIRTLDHRERPDSSGLAP